MYNEFEGLITDEDIFDIKEKTFVDDMSEREEVKSLTGGAAAGGAAGAAGGGAAGAAAK